MQEKKLLGLTSKLKNNGSDSYLKQKWDLYPVFLILQFIKFNMHTGKKAGAVFPCEPRLQPPVKPSGLKL